MFFSVSAALTAAAVLVTAPAQAQRRQVERNAFEWSGTVASGRHVYVHNLNGSVTIERSAGRTLEISATKSWRSGDPADVRIQAVRVGSGDGDLAMCAIWGDPDATCAATGVQRSRNRRSMNNRNDTQVDVVIRLPAGVHVDAHTTNGSLTISGASGNVVARTTNGDIVAETSEGSVEAGSTNGNIRVRMMRLPASSTSYSTTNGSITLEVPANLDFDIDARTTNGSISSDFDVSVSGTLSPRRIRGRVGRGGPTVTLSTTNGNIRLRRM